MRTMLSGVLVGLVVACHGGASPPAPVAAPASDVRRDAALAAPAGDTVELEAAWLGAVELAPANVPPMPALHVRLTIANNGFGVWRVDPRTAVLAHADRDVRAVFVNADVATLPIILVDRGERRVVDLYFPAADPEVTALALRIDVTTVARRFTWRAALAAPASMAALETDRARYWWADPTYPWPLFARESGIIATRPPRSVAVRRSPR